MLHAPVPQDAGGELVIGMTGPAQYHLYHLFTGPGGERGAGCCAHTLALGAAYLLLLS